MLWEKIGKPFPFLFWITISIPIIHQLYVWVTWRLELRSKTVSRVIGFRPYLVIFFILLIGRLVPFLMLCWANRESLGLEILPRLVLSILLLLPALYTMYSVKTYFGFTRAAGADHFELAYRNLPIVKRGIFKFSSNSMYVFGFMMFWAMAITFDAKAALLASAFGHIYIWIHYFSVEKPDMNYLYDSQKI